jgi:hypothetical protein
VTVKELIEKLQGCDPELEIYTESMVDRHKPVVFQYGPVCTEIYKFGDDWYIVKYDKRDTPEETKKIVLI